MRKILMVCALLGMSQITQAGDFKPYIGAGVGSSSISISITGTGTGSANSIGGFGVVGFDYGDYFGAELRIGATGNGSIAIGAISYDVSSDWFLSYLAKFQYPFFDHFKIYTLVGASTSKQTVRIVTPGWFFVTTGTNKDSTTKTTVSFGLGLDYQIVDQWNVGAEIMGYGNGLGMATLNLKYSF